MNKKVCWCLFCFFWNYHKVHTLSQPTSSFLDLLAVFVNSALSCLSLTLRFSTGVGCPPEVWSPGFRVAEPGPDTDVVHVASCFHSLPQASLHGAVLLFKNTVSCGVLTSLLSGSQLAPCQQAVAHFCLSIGGFLLHFSVYIFLYSWRFGERKQKGHKKMEPPFL